MNISFCNDDTSYMPRGRRLLRRWLEAVAAAEGWTTDQITYIYCSSSRLIAMNRQFLGHDYYTDVITFDYGCRSERTASGDIFIDVETVADNARIYGTAPRREMLRVTVHGLLHLCGQKDKSDHAARVMRRKENRYLKLYDSMAAQQ